MPMTLKSEGLDEISEMLGKLEAQANSIASQALYLGAGIVADEMNRSINTIQTEKFRWGTSGNRRLASPEEKEIVRQAGAGIATFKNEGGSEVSTSVGFSNAGYAELAGKTVPVPLIVNSINSGTSFMKKQPFARKAASSGGKKAVSAMKDYVETALDKITKE